MDINTNNQIIYDMDMNDFETFMNDSTITSNKKFELIKLAFRGKTKLDKDCSEVMYKYFHILNNDEIDDIYKMMPNNYYFFKNLTSLELVKKYFDTDSNIIHGITKNTFLTSEEKKTLLFNKN